MQILVIKDSSESATKQTKGTATQGRSSGPDGSRLVIAQSVSKSEDLQEYIFGAMVAILLVTIGLTLVLGWSLERRMLQPRKSS